MAPSVWCSQVGARMGARTQLGGGSHPAATPPPSNRAAETGSYDWTSVRGPTPTFVLIPNTVLWLLACRPAKNIQRTFGAGSAVLMGHFKCLFLRLAIYSG